MNLIADQRGVTRGLADYAAGIQCYLDDPSMAKPLSPGRAAFSGVLSALLVSRGMSGPGTSLESREGLFRSLVGKEAPPDLAVDLGARYALLDVGFKP